MKLRDKDKLKVVAGVNQLWWLPMTKVSVLPTMRLGVSDSNELRTSEVLRPIKIEGRTAEYSHKPERTEQGMLYSMALDCENLILDKEKDSELMAMMVPRLLIFFKDNHGNYRYILNARLTTDVGTGQQNGKPGYLFHVSRMDVVPAVYFTGNVSVETNGTVVLG